VGEFRFYVDNLYLDWRHIATIAQAPLIHHIFISDFSFHIMIIQELEVVKSPDSRNEETISIFLKTAHGRVSSSVPSGKSRGKYEVSPWSSKGIDFSISFLKMLGVKLISSQISFKKFEDLEKAEKLVLEYDKSDNFSLLGGNALLALECAILRAMALEESSEVWQFLNPHAHVLPRPLGNCIGGGMHVKKDNRTDIQEFLVCPKTSHFYDSYFINLQAYKELKKSIVENDKSWNGELTDEKAMASSLPTDYILSMIEAAGETIKKKYKFEIECGVDVASSTFFDAKEKEYVYRNLPQRLDSEKQIAYISNLIKTHSLFYVEDPLHEDDFEGFAKLLKKVKNCLIVGDDLTATNIDRLKKAVDMKSINAMIIKPNQNGSLLRTKEVVDFAKANKIVPIISHRSGETSDSMIADLAVAWEIPFIKSGILGKERMAKLNRLMKIEREMAK